MFHPVHSSEQCTDCTILICTHGPSCTKYGGMYSLYFIIIVFVHMMHPMYFLIFENMSNWWCITFPQTLPLFIAIEQSYM